VLHRIANKWYNCLLVFSRVFVTDYIETNDDLDKFIDIVKEELVVQNGGKRRKKKSFSIHITD
jgi:hypothetical protein